MKLLVLILTFAALSISQPLESTPEFKEARALYFHGADGDSKASDRAEKLFSQLNEQHPKVPRIEVYCGSLRLLAARTLGFSGRKIRSREKAFS